MLKCGLGNHHVLGSVPLQCGNGLRRTSFLDRSIEVQRQHDQSRESFAPLTANHQAADAFYSTAMAYI